MNNQKSLTNIYRQNLEENIIKQLALIQKISLRDAMDIFYKSKLSKQIEIGENGIDNLDYKNLTENLIQTELNK